MNREQAAVRLGVVRNAVLDVVEHTGGHVATLYDGRQMLIGPTVARRYVPEVDDPVEEPSAEPATPARRPPAETAAIREWAKGVGYELADKGRIPADVVAAYNAAHAAGGEVPDAGQSQD